MANPFAVAAMLARMQVTLTCPHCDQKKVVRRQPAAFRTCPRCKKQFPDPLTKKKK
ncbi:MAG: hypothetical protein H0T46_35645 [Deltaproteobacteria bacterium]|nr:hypothetical protein [Deltaproteobacteria bacterium]